MSESPPDFEMDPLAEEFGPLLRDGLAPVATAVGAIVVGPEDLDDGDLPITIGGVALAGFRLVGLNGALDRLIAQVEREFGQTVATLDREGKQNVVRRLDELGAFSLRKAVEDVAERLAISRFTVYNYLNTKT